jgi:hypothetical protein
MSRCDPIMHSYGIDTHRNLPNCLERDLRFERWATALAGEGYRTQRGRSRLGSTARPNL